MSLYGRISGDETPKINTHSFNAGVREWSRGAVTRQQMIDTFALTAAEQTELDSLKSQHDGQPNATSKVVYLMKLNDVFLLSEVKIYTEAKAKSELGF